jgi:hypothetical protein
LKVDVDGTEGGKGGGFDGDVERAKDGGDFVGGGKLGASGGLCNGLRGRSEDEGLSGGGTGKSGGGEEEEGKGEERGAHVRTPLLAASIGYVRGRGEGKKIMVR